MKKPFYIRKLYLYQYEVPLKTIIFIRGISFSSKKGLLVKIEDEEENILWGEISLLPPTEEKIKNCKGWIENNYECLLGAMNKACSKIPIEVKFALASAIDSFRIEENNSLDITIKTNTLLAGKTENIIKEAKKKSDLGYTIFKLKLGEFSITESIDLISQIREIIGRERCIVLDLNQQWELSKTLDFIERILNKNILYIEDPVTNLDELVSYLKVSPIKAGVDEFLEGWNLQLEDICEEFSDRIVFVMKPSVLYGSDAWQKILNNEYSMKVFTSAWETGVGLRGVLNTILKYKDNVKFAGLDTYSFLKYDIVEPALSIMSPEITLKMLQEKFTVIEDKLELINSWVI